MNGPDEPLWSIVVPTKGERREHLRECIESIAQVPIEQKEIIVISKLQTHLPKFVDLDIKVFERDLGLSEAINLGLEISRGRYFSWLSDDDRLLPRFAELFKFLQCTEDGPKASMVFGGCSYINEQGFFLTQARSNRFATTIMRYGPNLIPQPATLFCKEAVFQVGGIDTELKFAMDQDLYRKLNKISRITYCNYVVAKYTFHENTLTNLNRLESIRESLKVRLIDRNMFAVLVNLLLFPLTALAVYFGGWYLTTLNNRLKKT